MSAVKKTEEFHKKACEYLEMDFDLYKISLDDLFKNDMVCFCAKIGEIVKNVENMNVDVKEIDRETCLKAYKFCTRYEKDFGIKVNYGPKFHENMNLKTVMHSDKLLKEYGFDRRQLNMEVRRQELAECEEMLAFRK